MRSLSALGVLLAVFLALHLLYNGLIPLGEGPDEPGHFDYVVFLAREGRLPVQAAEHGASDVPGEGHQPPLAYLLAAPAVAWLPEAERQLTISPDPDFVWAGGSGAAAFRRGSREHWPWQGLGLAWHLARGVSGLWGAATVALTFLAARALRPADLFFAMLAAALLAFNPQFLFATALVGNDALLAALAAATLWLCLRELDPREKATGRFLLLGALFGLALLTKQSALLLGPLLLWACWRASNRSPRRFGWLGLAWAGATLLVAGWWFLRNWQLYGDPFGLAVFSAEFTTQPFNWRDPAAWGAAVVQLFGSFWARFGWMSVRPPDWTIWLYAALCAVAGLGWALPLRRARESSNSALHHHGVTETRRPTRAVGEKGASQAVLGSRFLALRSRWAGPLLVLGMALLWITSFAFTAGLVAWQGRLIFPAAAAAALLLAEGIRRAISGVQIRHLAVPFGYGAGLSVLLALAVFMPIGVIRPAYRWEVLPPADALARLGTPAYARFAQSWERGVELRGWRLDGPARPGTVLPVTLTWHSLEPIPRSWTVFVHLVDGNGTIVAHDNSRPRGAALPFTAWTPGDWVDDTHPLLLPADLDAGTYRLRVGLYRPEKNDQRQGVWDAAGELIGDLAELGVVVVES